MNLFSVNGAFVPKITLDEHGRRNRFTQGTTEEDEGVIDNPTVATFLEALNNLSDLTSAATARINLGLGTAAVLNSDGLFNAGSIKGVTIDDTAKADGKVLSFNAGTNRVVYVSPSEGGGSGDSFDQDLNTTDDVTFNSVTFPNGGVVSGDAETESIAHSVDIYTPGMVFCGGVSSCGGAGSSHLGSMNSMSFESDASGIFMNGSNLASVGEISMLNDDAETPHAIVFNETETSFTRIHADNNGLDAGGLRITADNGSGGVTIDTNSLVVNGQVTVGGDLDMQGYAIRTTGNISLNTSTEVLPSIYFRNDEDATVRIHNSPFTPDLRIDLDSGTGKLVVDGDLDLNGHSILNAVGGGGGGGFNVLEDGLHATDNVQMDDHDLYMEGGDLWFGEIVEGKMNHISQNGNGLMIGSDDNIWLPTPSCQVQIDSDEEGSFTVWGDNAYFNTQVFYTGAETVLFGNSDSDGTNAVAIGFNNHVGFGAQNATYTIDFTGLTISDGDTIILYDTNDTQFIFEFDNDSTYDSGASHIQVILDADPLQTAANFLSVINTGSETYHMTAEDLTNGTIRIVQSVAGSSGNTLVEGTLISDSFISGFDPTQNCFAFGANLNQDEQDKESNVMLLGFSSNSILINDSGFSFDASGFSVFLPEGEKADFSNAPINVSLVEFGPQSEGGVNYIERFDSSLRLFSDDLIILEGNISTQGKNIDMGVDVGEGVSYGNIGCGGLTVHSTTNFLSAVALNDNSISGVGSVETGVITGRGETTSFKVNSTLLGFYNANPVAKAAAPILAEGLVNSGDSGTDDAINNIIQRVVDIENALVNLGLMAEPLPPA